MMPFRKIGPCTLYHGDAMEIMPAIITEGFQADLIVDDPPYRLTCGGKNAGRNGDFSRMSGIFDVKNYTNDGGIVDCDIDWSDFMPLFYSCLGDQGHCYVMANNRNVQAMLNAADAAGFGFHNLLVWDKITATPNRWYMKNCEFTGLFYKGHAMAIMDCSSKQLITCPQVDVTAHPTEKPVALMQHYIENSSKSGDVVFDPFMGSGTTGIAAMRSGRMFVGIEKNQIFFDMAIARIKHEFNNLQINLFG